MQTLHRNDSVGPESSYYKATVITTVPPCCLVDIRCIPLCIYYLTSSSGMFWTEIPLISRTVSPTWIISLSSALVLDVSNLERVDVTEWAKTMGDDEAAKSWCCVNVQTHWDTLIIGLFPSTEHWSTANESPLLLSAEGGNDTSATVWGSLEHPDPGRLTDARW